MVFWATGSDGAQGGPTVTAKPAARLGEWHSLPLDQHAFFRSRAAMNAFLAASALASPRRASDSTSAALPHALPLPGHARWMRECRYLIKDHPHAGPETTRLVASAVANQAGEPGLPRYFSPSTPVQPTSNSTGNAFQMFIKCPQKGQAYPNLAMVEETTGCIDYAYFTTIHEQTVRKKVAIKESDEI